MDGIVRQFHEEGPSGLDLFFHKFMGTASNAENAFGIVGRQRNSVLDGQMVAFAVVGVAVALVIFGMGGRSGIEPPFAEIFRNIIRIDRFYHLRYRNVVLAVDAPVVGQAVMHDGLLETAGSFAELQARSARRTSRRRRLSIGKNHSLFRHSLQSRSMEEIASAVGAIFHHPNGSVGPALIIREE